MCLPSLNFGNILTSGGVWKLEFRAEMICLFGYDAVTIVESYPVFRRCMVLPSSEENNPEDTILH
jgi:hypothetical protein